MSLTNRRDFLRATAAASTLCALRARAPPVPAGPLGISWLKGVSGSCETGCGVQVTVAGLLFVTASGAGPRVAAALIGEAGLELTGGDGDSRLGAVWQARGRGTLDATAQRLLLADPELLGIHATFVERDDGA